MPQVDLGQVVGPQGPQGEPGPAGPQGIQGPPGQDVTLPSGGTSGQVLTKTEDGAEWADAPVTEERLEEALSTKQNTLTGAPGQVVGFDATGAALPVQGWSNTNLLDNAYWANEDAIINQKGQTEYTGPGYGIDRWIHDTNSATLSITTNGISFSGQITGPDAQRYFSQKIDMPPELFYGKTLTGSLMVDGQLFFGTVTIGEQYGTWESETCFQANDFSVSIQMTEIGIFRFILIYSQSFLDNNSTLQAAKLEFGDHQTLAHQDADGNWVFNDPPPNKALEMLKCQRYQYVCKSLSDYGLIGIGAIRENNSANISVTTHVMLRSVPAISYGGTLVLDIGGIGYNISSMNLDGISDNAVSIICDASAGSITLPKGSFAMLRADNSINAHILFDSNL